MKAKKEDCICEPEFSKIDFGNSKPVSFRYNPRCTFHKGPDAGYGYDEWGRPNGKHSELVGKIGAGVIVVALVVSVAFVVALAFGAFG